MALERHFSKQNHFYPFKAAFFVVACVMLQMAINLLIAKTAGPEMVVRIVNRTIISRFSELNDTEYASIKRTVQLIQQRVSSASLLPETIFSRKNLTLFTFRTQGHCCGVYSYVVVLKESIRCDNTNPLGTAIMVTCRWPITRVRAVIDSTKRWTSNLAIAPRKNCRWPEAVESCSTSTPTISVISLKSTSPTGSF